MTTTTSPNNVEPGTLNVEHRTLNVEPSPSLEPRTLNLEQSSSVEPRTLNIERSSSAIAVLGAGYWGKNLVRNFHQLALQENNVH